VACNRCGICNGSDQPGAKVNNVGDYDDGMLLGGIFFQKEEVEGGAL